MSRKVTLDMFEKKEYFEFSEDMEDDQALHGFQSVSETFTVSARQLGVLMNQAGWLRPEYRLYKSKKGFPLILHKSVDINDIYQGEDVFRNDYSTENGGRTMHVTGLRGGESKNPIMKAERNFTVTKKNALGQVIPNEFVEIEEGTEWEIYESPRGGLTRLKNINDGRIVDLTDDEMSLNEEKER